MEKLIAKQNIKESTVFTVLWVFFWVGVFAIHDGVLKPMGHNYLHSPLLVFSFFTSSGLLAAKVFKMMSCTEREVKTWNTALLIGAIFLSYIVLAGVTRSLFPVAPERLEWFASMKLFSANFFPRASFAKSGDIFFQQVMIFSFVQNFKRMDFTSRETMTFFTLAFFSVHLPALYFLSYVGFLFIIPSLAAGILFSYLILRYKRGFLHSLSIHLGFYYVLGLVLRYAVSF